MSVTPLKSTMHNFPKLAILVLSCDKYEKLWKLFFSRFNRYWNDFDGKIYLLTNQLSYSSDDVISVCVGPDIDWSSNLETALKKINEENILLMIEDAPLNGFVNNEDFLKIYKKFCSKNMNYLNLKANPKPSKKSEGEYGEILPGSLYRTSLVPCIWKKETLLTILKKGETAWEFEINGSLRSDLIPQFYSMNKPVFEILHCVVRGKLDPRAFNILKIKNEHINLQFHVMNFGEYLFLKIKELRSCILNKLIPSSMRRSVRNILIKFTDW
jgi:hypothetical protein